MPGGGRAAVCRSVGCGRALPATDPGVGLPKCSSFALSANCVTLGKLPKSSSFWEGGGLTSLGVK